jgi:hypothetical protein
MFDSAEFGELVQTLRVLLECEMLMSFGTFGTVVEEHAFPELLVYLGDAEKRLLEAVVEAEGDDVQAQCPYLRPVASQQEFISCPTRGPIPASPAAFSTFLPCSSVPVRKNTSSPLNL